MIKLYYRLDRDPKAAALRKSFLSIFPDAVLGIELTNHTRLIFLYGATYNLEGNCINVQSCFLLLSNTAGAK